MSLPDTPVVFESGVLRFEDDGTLHVHLSHSADAPHPLACQPDGSEDPVPVSVSEAACIGSGDGHFRSRASLPEAETLPEGLQLTFRGYEFVQIEMSGDVSVLMRSPESLPDWFMPGKVHRFDGPEDGVRLWTGSSKPPAPPPLRVPTPPRRPTPAASAPSASAPSASASSASAPSGSAPDSASKTGKSGCGPLLVLASVLPAVLWLL